MIYIIITGFLSVNEINEYFFFTPLEFLNGQLPIQIKISKV